MKIRHACVFAMNRLQERAEREPVAPTQQRGWLKVDFALTSSDLRDIAGGLMVPAVENATDALVKAVGSDAILDVAQTCKLRVLPGGRQAAYFDNDGRSQLWCKVTGDEGGVVTFQLHYRQASVMAAMAPASEVA